jgi:hypothetical protein
MMNQQPSSNLGEFALGGWPEPLPLLESPVRRPCQRTALLIASHLVWGVSLALATEGLQRFFRSR